MANKDLTPEEIAKKLSAPFTKEGPNCIVVPDHKWFPKDFKTTPGHVQCYPYITARQVSERLDEVLGIDKWASNLVKEDDRTICTISVSMNGDWIDKTDIGTPSAYAKAKGETSDALKRAAVHLGVGRYLHKMEPVILKAKNNKIPLTDKGEPLTTNEALTSYINTKHPLRMKFIEIYNALDPLDRKAHENAFTKIWNDLAK